MARTTQMRLIELMALRQDISNVIEYLGKNGNFQFQEKRRSSQPNAEKTEELNVDEEIFTELEKTRAFLKIQDLESGDLDCPKATDEDRNAAAKIISAVKELSDKLSFAMDEKKRVLDAYNEALAFSNLQVPYSQLEQLSFLSLKIGRIPQEAFQDLCDAVGKNAVIVPVGNDNTRILAASSKKGRFALDTELEKAGFVEMKIPKEFKGIPEDVLESLKAEKASTEESLTKVQSECENYTNSHKDEIIRLLKAFFISSEIEKVQAKLESTEMVFHITGWIPVSDSERLMKDLDELTEGRLALREYDPMEVPSVINGEEQVPVKLTHGKIIKNFERMIFSYGSPLYGNIDPTPFVAVFFTLLFGIMFGDAGQGLVFLILGILMTKKLFKLGGWEKFNIIFMAIGISSMIMGLITGEFFTNEEILKPFALWVTGLFGNPHAPIVKMMPSSDPNSIKVIFGIFGITMALGFVINTIGLIINIVNNFRQKHFGKACFGKFGLSGACFFWYVVIFAIRVAFFKHAPQVYDWLVIGITLFFAAFGEPFERLLDGERPVLENGVGSAIIGGVVELIEVLSTYLSNSISFVRVGAFALAHAVLGFIINLMAEKCGVAGGALVLVVGNVIVVVLEGMIVSIQVIRLQYYEFFSKFFSETGSEFKPFRFHYGK